MTYAHPTCPPPPRTMLRPARKTSARVGTSLWRSVRSRFLAGMSDEQILAECAPEGRFIARTYLECLAGGMV